MLSTVCLNRPKLQSCVSTFKILHVSAISLKQPPKYLDRYIWKLRTLYINIACYIFAMQYLYWDAYIDIYPYMYVCDIIIIMTPGVMTSPSRTLMMLGWFSLDMILISLRIRLISVSSLIFSFLMYLIATCKKKSRKISIFKKSELFRERKPLSSFSASLIKQILKRIKLVRGVKIGDFY